MVDMKLRILAFVILILVVGCAKETPKKQLTVNVTPDVGGSVTPSTGTYAMGSTVKLNANPSGEYVFKEWQGGITGTINPANVIMDGDKTVTAVFEKRQYPLSLTIFGLGTVKEEIIKTASTATNYTSGTTVRLTPQPSAGYQFKRWSGDDTTYKIPLDIVVSKPVNLTCTFEKMAITSLRIDNLIDTLIISKKHKYNIKGVYTNGTTVDLSDSVKITSSSKGLNILNDKSFVGAKSGSLFVEISFNNLLIKDTIYVSEIEDVKILDSYLNRPINESKLIVPVVIINYMPTSDGLTKDVSKASGYFTLQNRTLDEVKTSLINACKGVKFSAEEGSKFRGYNDKNAKPYVGIQVIKQFNLYEIPLMPATFKNQASYAIDPMNEPNYNLIFTKIGLKSLVEDFGVKEVWFNVSHLHKGLPSYDSKIHISQNLVVMPESNMSSPSGDISNSFRQNSDLPIYNKTYVVYGFNYNGAFDLIDFIPSNIHVRSHQIEIQLNEIDVSPKKELWNNMFVGIPVNGGKPSGRSGNVHFPPNAKDDYDYNNLNFVNSDIGDWRPDGMGAYKSVNKLTWNNAGYIWPSGVFSDAQSNWLLYWYQSIPNFDNKLSYKEFQLTNWWDLFYNWDDALKTKRSLYK